MSSDHIAILVGGTLLHAQQGVRQLKMQGIGGDTVAGIGAVFGSRGGLEAETSEGKWTPLRSLTGRWLLVVPEDAYAAFRGELSSVITRELVDGRVPSPQEAWQMALLNVSASAVARVEEILGLTQKHGSKPAEAPAGSEEKPWWKFW